MKNKFLFTITATVIITMLLSSCVSPQQSEDMIFFDSVLYDFSIAETIDLDRTITYEIVFDDSDFSQRETSVFYSDAKVLRDTNNYDNPKIFSTTNADIFDVKLEFESYVSENIEYNRIEIDNDQEVKFKADLPPDEARRMIENSNYITSNKDTENLIIQQDGKNYIFSYNLKKRLYSRYSNDFSLLLVAMGVDPSDTGLYSIEYMNFTYIVNGDNIITNSIRETGLKVKSNGYTFPVTVKVETKYNSYGKPVNINFPSFNGYTDINE